MLDMFAKIKILFPLLSALGSNVAFIPQRAVNKPQESHDLNIQEYNQLMAALTPENRQAVKEMLLTDYEQKYKEAFLAKRLFVRKGFKTALKESICKLSKEIFDELSLNEENRNEILTSIKNYKKDLKQKLFFDTLLVVTHNGLSSRTSHAIEYFKNIYGISPFLSAKEKNTYSIDDTAVKWIGSKSFKLLLSPLFFNEKLSESSSYHNFIIGHELAHIKHGHKKQQQLFSKADSSIDDRVQFYTTYPSMFELDSLQERQADIEAASVSLELARQYRQIAKDLLIKDLQNNDPDLNGARVAIKSDKRAHGHITALDRYCIATELFKFKEQEEKWLRSPEGDAQYGTVAYERMWDRWCEQNK